MRREQVRTMDEALVYLVDCTLATVCHLAMVKSKSKSEYRRQIDMAQFGIDNIMKNLSDASDRVKEAVRNSRAHDILKRNIKVDEWAKGFEELPS